MKKFFLTFFTFVFPFSAFLVLDLPGAALVALGLQSTIIGWPIAAIWAFKHVSKEIEDDKLKNVAAAAAAAATAAAEATVAAQAAAAAAIAKAQQEQEKKLK